MAGQWHLVRSDEFISRLCLSISLVFFLLRYCRNVSHYIIFSSIPLRHCEVLASQKSEKVISNDLSGREEKIGERTECNGSLDGLIYGEKTSFLVYQFGISYQQNLRVYKYILRSRLVVKYEKLICDFFSSPTSNPFIPASHKKFFAAPITSTNVLLFCWWRRWFECCFSFVGKFIHFHGMENAFCTLQEKRQEHERDEQRRRVESTLLL